MSYINVLKAKCIGECGSTNCEECRLLLLLSLISNYEILGLRLALKWASWEVNLTIYTRTELDRLTKGVVI